MDIELKLKKCAEDLVNTFYLCDKDFGWAMETVTGPPSESVQLRDAFLAGYGVALGWDVQEWPEEIKHDFLALVKQVKEEDIN
jgi:hypothetical protein